MEVTATEQKTIFEELLEDVPIQRQRKHKLMQARLHVTRDEWDEAAALLDEIEAEHPDDEEAAAIRKQLKEKLAKVEAALKKEEEHRREQEEHRRAHEEHRREQEEQRELLKQRDKEQREPISKKKVLITCLLIFLVICIAAAAVLGINVHRQSLQYLYDDAAVSTAQTAATGNENNTIKTDACVRFLFTFTLENNGGDIL